MWIELILTLLMIPALLSAQDRVTVKGRIVNDKGEAVEYVQIGVPKHQIGTISTADGRFEISMPPDTLDFFHVSYQGARYPVTASVDDIVIVLHENELPPAVSIGGDTKEKYLLQSGKNFLGKGAAIGFALTEGQPTGKEVGSIAQVKKPFLVQDISFTLQSNGIPGCVMSINIYRIEGKRESFVNVLHKPIYFDVALTDAPQKNNLQPEEPLLLEPGRYFIAFQIVEYDKEAFQAFQAKPHEERKIGEMSMYFYMYLKSTYVREVALGEMKHLPVSIGMVVRGLEYQ